MPWTAGSTIHVDSPTVGHAPRAGSIIEAIGEQGAIHYRVRWNDGRESIYYPGPDGHVVASPQHDQAELQRKPRVMHLGDAIGSFMSAPPSGISTETTLRDVATSLTDEAIGALMVFEDGQPVGVISERDVVRSLAAGADPDEVWAADVMSTETVWGSPDDSVIDAADALSAAGVRHLPLRQGGRLVGIVSSQDILSAILGSQGPTSDDAPGE